MMIKYLTQSFKNEPVYNSLKIAILLFILVQIIIYFFLPLIPQSNDSGWYYMNVHFMLTRNYTNESMYPSFDEPSQLYPVLGYSFPLFILKLISNFTGIPWYILVKLMQITCYLASIYFFFYTLSILSNHIIGIVSIGFYIAFYSIFNFAGFIMSETWFLFLLSLNTFLLVRFLFTKSKLFLAFTFLLSGYMILVKPVYLVVLPILLASGILVLDMKQLKNKVFIGILLVCFFWTGFIQSFVAQNLYKNSTVRSGIGWNLWNRVIYQDQLIPKHSLALDELKQIFKAHGKEVKFGYWWDVTRELSNFGYKEKFTQDICKRIALDAMKEHPWKYVYNTFKAFFNNLTLGQPSDQIYLSKNEYSDYVKKFGKEQQHTPLTLQLEKQFKNQILPDNQQIFILNSKLAWFSDVFINPILFNTFTALIFIISSVFIFILLIISRFQKEILAIFILVYQSWAILFGSVLFEFYQPKFTIPVVIFNVAIILIGGWLLYTQKWKTRELI